MKVMAGFGIKTPEQIQTLLPHCDAAIAGSYIVKPVGAAYSERLDSFSVSDLYYTNFHDFKILPNGNYILIGNEYTIVDMDTIIAGGQKNATLINNIIQ